MLCHIQRSARDERGCAVNVAIWTTAYGAGRCVCVRLSPKLVYIRPCQLEAHMADLKLWEGSSRSSVQARGKKAWLCSGSADLTFFLFPLSRTLRLACDSEREEYREFSS